MKRLKNQRVRKKRSALLTTPQGAIYPKNWIWIEYLQIIMMVLLTDTCRYEKTMLRFRWVSRKNLELKKTKLNVYLCFV